MTNISNSTFSNKQQLDWQNEKSTVLGITALEDLCFTFLKSSNNCINVINIYVYEGVFITTTMSIKMTIHLRYCHKLIINICIYINFILFANDSHLISSNIGGKS